MLAPGKIAFAGVRVEEIVSLAEEKVAILASVSVFSHMRRRINSELNSSLYMYLWPRDVSKGGQEAWVDEGSINLQEDVLCNE